MTPASADGSKINIAEFIIGGGEMGELVRSFDWSETSIGPVSQWPQSLRSTLGILLHSSYPMFLWWGNDLVQFYNDGYRPSLGNNGKHPTALGQRAVECWPEIWEVIKPLIDRVFAGESTWSEDQLIPIYINGALENVYWTFGYSPVYDESGKVGGVLVVCNETTEKVNNIRATENRERLLRNIFSKAPVAVATFRGPTFIIDTANEKVLEFWGRSLEQVINKPLFEALPEAAGQGFEELLTEVYTTGKAFTAKELQVNLERKGKLEKTYINFVYEAYYNTDGNIIGVIVVANEITEQVLSRQKIEESEQRFRSLIQEAPVATSLLTGEELKIELANEAVLQLWNKEKSIIGKTLKEAIPELEGQPFLQILEDAYKTGKTFTAKATPAVLMVNGVPKTHYFDFTNKPIFDNNGEVWAILSMGSEVTAQVEATKKIEESEERSRLSINAAKLGTYELSLDTMKIIASDRLDEIFDVSHSTDQRHYLAALNKDDLKIREKAFETALDTGILDYVTRIVCKNETTRWVRITGNVYFDKEHKPTKILGVAQDITAQKEIDQQKDDFISIVSHELRTPLTSILAYTEILNEKFSLTGDEDTRMMLSKMKTQAHRLNLIIKDMVDVTRIEGSKIILRQDDVDFKELVMEIIEEVQRTSKTHNISVERIESAMVTVDKERTSQVLTNLLSNAIKYSPKDTSVIVSAYRQNDEVICSIKDFGIGIPTDMHTKIFERFYQVLDTRRFNAGFGLGLYISAQIIQRQHGKIWVESEPDKGATFYFSLPLKNK